jgi:hypothetical protein
MVLLGHHGRWHPILSIIQAEVPCRLPRLNSLIPPPFVLCLAASSHHRFELVLGFTMMATLAISGAQGNFHAPIVYETSRIVAVPHWSFSSVAAHL